MALFHPESHEEWRRKRSQEQLALGGLPLNAEHRLRRLAAHPHLFTSTLSVNGMVLAQAAGLTPCGQVSGTSVFHTGWKQLPVFTSAEITPLSQAQTQVRRMALVRMLREAQQLGAQGVVDVRLLRNTHDWGSDAVEFTAIGTAIRCPWLHPNVFPFACTLSGQDLLALHQAGYVPAGLALGVCVYYQVASQATTRIMQGGVFNSAARINQEMIEYTWGLNNARRHATRCLEEDAVCQHAEGVLDIHTEKQLEVREVEVEIYEKKQQRQDLIATFSAFGTIVRSTERPLPSIKAALSLNPKGE